MANPEHLKILKQGVGEWNKWREENPDVDPDFHEADLRGADLGAVLREAHLRGANLGRADLSGANLTGANLSFADLGHADLGHADLCRSNVRGAMLVGADLHQADLLAADLSTWVMSEGDSVGIGRAHLGDANLSGANLIWANLSGAYLRGADFTGARAGATIFANVDLSVARGIETIEHQGPSTISIDTIYESHGNIPEVFLRGCGVPENFIAYMHSLAGQAFEFYSCFISYSTKYQEFAERLYNDLQGNGVRCWFAPHDIQGGRKIHEQIDDAIRLHDKLLLILSDDSMNSEWVKTEIAKARKRELNEKRKMLFPVSLAPYDPVVKDWECFDADTGKDSAREIREYYIPDFSSWKEHDSYQKAFQRLVGDLKAVASSQ